MSGESGMYVVAFYTHGGRLCEAFPSVEVWLGTCGHVEPSLTLGTWQ